MSKYDLTQTANYFVATDPIGMPENRKNAVNLILAYAFKSGVMAAKGGVIQKGDCRKIIRSLLDADETLCAAGALLVGKNLEVSHGFETKGSFIPVQVVHVAMAAYDIQRAGLLNVALKQTTDINNLEEK